MDPSINKTIQGFGYPASLIKEYGHWVVLLRPKQPGLASLILACKGDFTSFSSIGADAHREMQTVIRDIETTLSGQFDYDKINYLMLMMVDPHVHFHVIPRYSSSRDFAGARFADPAWPGPPDLTHNNATDGYVSATLLPTLKSAWPV